MVEFEPNIYVKGYREPEFWKFSFFGIKFVQLYQISIFVGLVPIGMTV